MEGKEPLYPHQIVEPYQGGVPLQPMQQQHVQVVAQQVPPTPEVVHHDRRNRDEDDSDDESDTGIDHKSPGEVPTKYLNLEYKATFHEHEKTKVLEPVSKVLEIIYRWIKLIVYHFFVFIIGIPLMLMWAFLNGIMAFIYSWMWSPVLRISIFWLAATLPLATMPLVTIFRPLIDVAARCLRQIRLKGALTGNGFVQNV